MDNQEDNISNPNQHVSEYLNNYLSLENPEYAILLNGKWGSGKTYFIQSYIENFKDKNKNIKFIKISLFGLKDTNSIDEEIFQNLHPLLGSKYAKLTGNILKGALKLGINFDWNLDDKKDETANIDLKNFNPLDFFSDNKKSNQEIVFIFDDLERTEINLKEILGYINYLVEQSKFKVIILANEEKVDKTEYIEFKEKVIGKTFEVKHSFKQILVSFIDNKTDISKEMLNSNIQLIQSIYEKATYNNLRHISQILFDFEYFIKNISKDYLNNKEFISTLINNFFALSIELKSSNLTREELSKRPIILWNFSDDKNEKKTKVEEIYEKYDIKNNPLFDGKNWVKILLNNSVQKEELNDLISNLSFFIEKKEKTQPSWVKLWHYRELSDEDFTKNLNDMLNKFNNCEYEIPEHFIHVIALLIYFSKNKLCDLLMADIENRVENCIKNKYQNHKNWKNQLFEDRIRFNRTGLGYMGEDDKDFRNIFSKIITENKEIYDNEEKNKQKKLSSELLESIKILNEDFLINLLLEQYRTIPIFKQLNTQNFVDILTKSENKNISRLGEILHSRYGDHYYISNKVSYCFLTDELDFWKDVNVKLSQFLKKNKDNNKLKRFLLNQFKKHLVEKVINKLKGCLEPNKTSYNNK